MTDLLVERDRGVVVLTLNRPERRNAISAQMWAQLSVILREVAQRPADRVLVLRGAGDCFSSGAEIGAGANTEPPFTVMRRIGGVTTQLFNLPKPTVAAINGVAYGAGANLAFACDFALATKRSTFCEIFSRRAMSVDCGGSWLLPRLIGLRRAKELVFLADVITAEQARDVGLIGSVVEDCELAGATQALADRLADGPALALSLSKQLLQDAAARTFEDAVEAESQAQVVNARGPDLREAVAAFRERRDPVFRPPGDPHPAVDC